MQNYICTLLILFTGAGCQMGKDQPVVKIFSEEVSSLYDSSRKPFYHGVASGDPLTDRVIIWTRVTPKDSLSSIEVVWEIADNDQFDPVVQNGSLTTFPSNDYTVKVDVGGLNSNSYYYFRFTALDKKSPTGRTKTLPQGNVDSLKFAVVSCSNWQFGYFNAYNRIAEKDVDVVLHLGDYIYEYGVDGYGNKKVDRKHLPAHEIITLQDYRTRYSQYHLDEGLQNMRQQHPMIAIWDDHEVANNTYVDGAENHQPDKEGIFIERKAAAKIAYYEWIPIRESGKHYRNFTFGNLAALIMLDERLEGKTKPAEGISDPAYNNNDRSILGNEQLTWFQEKLKNASGAWKIIGNQVIFSDVDRSTINPKNPRNMDSWDGYPAEKKKIAEFIKSNNLKNIIFLTGDTHASWAFEVVVNPLRNQKNKSSIPLAVEFGTTSITSGNANESTSDDTVKLTEQAYLKANPHLKFTNQRDHGYLLLTLYHGKAKAEWYYVETLVKPDEREQLARTLEVNYNSNTLH